MSLELNQEAIEQSVIQTVADQIIADSNLESRIKTAIDARVDSHFRTIGEKQITDAVNRAIHDGFEHEYCKTDSFGRKSGEPTTIRKELERLISGYWNQMVDKNGKPSDSSYGSVTRAEWFMTELTASDFKGEMKQHIVNIAGSLKDSLRSKLRETVDHLLSEVFYVKSEEDQKLGNPGRSCINPEQTGRS